MTATGRLDGRVTYRERILVPWWMWAVLVMLALSVLFVLLVVVAPGIALLAALGAMLLGSVGLARSTAVVEVRCAGPTDAVLRAGRAALPLWAAGAVLALDPERAAYARGPGIDARAYHLLRAWVPTAVLVEVVDPEDPTPYWYVSTRRPQRLVEALEEARPRT